MANLGKKLGKLSLAILENFVEGVLGEKFVDELRAPTDRELAIETALENSEKRFAQEFSDKDFAEEMFLGVNDQNLGLLSDAVEKFYDHPTDPDFQNTLHKIIAESFSDISTDIVDSATYLYVTILTEEFALADEKFRGKIQALANLRTANTLRNSGKAPVSQKETSIMKSSHGITTPEMIKELLKFKSNNEFSDLVVSFLRKIGKRHTDLPKQIAQLTHTDFILYLDQIDEFDRFYKHVLENNDNRR